MKPSPDTNNLSDDLARLSRQVERLELDLERARAAARRRRRVAMRGGLATMLVGMLAWTGASLAADGSCPNSVLFCFEPNQPARASEVNHNFTQLLAWLEQKVGAAGNADVAATGPIATTKTISADGNITSAGIVSAREGLQAGNGSSADAGDVVAGLTVKRGNDQALFGLRARGSGRDELDSYIEFGDNATDRLVLANRDGTSQQDAMVVARHGVTVPGDLNVQGDITNIKVHGPFHAHRLPGDDGSATKDLGNRNNRVCFLTRVYVEETDDPGEAVQCVIEPSGDNWQLRAWKENPADQSVECSARCLSW